MKRLLKCAAIGAVVVPSTVTLLAVLDARSTKRKQRQAVLKHDGIRPAWGWSW